MKTRCRTYSELKFFVIKDMVGTTDEARFVSKDLMVILGHVGECPCL